MKRYTERYWLRSLEKTWVRLNALIDRLVKADFNPLYHLDTLTIFLLIVLIVTGIYLTIFYRPGADVAYATVQAISSNWFGLLMRSLHRYASDGMMVVILLHALKMFLSDRYWGQRWLAWTSGWIMLAVTWLVGTFGYWLVWDQRAQWMTEYLMRTIGGSIGLTFVSRELASKTFASFVIILFLHLFIPLLGFLGVYIHEWRLARGRWWTPRWVALQTLIGLIVLALLRPVSLLAPADLSTLARDVPMDVLYLGFLPLIEAWGNVVFWGLALLLGGCLVMLPWLAPGKDDGPAMVTHSRCTGCELCFKECPYDAIQMVRREDESPYAKLAVVQASQCTGCGICVGACPTDAIRLQNGYSGEGVFTAFKEAVQREIQNGHLVIGVFANERVQSLGGLPEALSSGKSEGPITVSPWGEREDVRIVTAVFPSSGAINVKWFRFLPRIGIHHMVLISEPLDDDRTREGGIWILSRLNRHPGLVMPGLHWLEIAPADSSKVRAFLDRLIEAAPTGKRPTSGLPSLKDRQKRWPSLVSALVGTILLSGLFALALLMDLPASMKDSDQAGLRLALDARGKVARAELPAGFVLPENADAEKIFGGRHYPIRARLFVDGHLALDKEFKPSGISGNGRIYGLEFLVVSPGTHWIEIWLKDEEADFRQVYSGWQEFTPSRVLVFAYNEQTDQFEVR